MRYIILSSLVCATSLCAVSRAQSRIAGWIDLEGHIVVQSVGGATIRVAGIDLVSESGKLVPVPPGDLMAPADPFEFFLANNPRQITYGKLGTALPISDGLVLSAMFDLTGSNPCDDLTLRAGTGPPEGWLPAGVPSPRQSSAFCTIPGDTDLDGDVEFDDFLTFAANFALAEAEWPQGDFNWDRHVGLADFLHLRANFGQPADSAAGASAGQVAGVPEPASAVLLLCALLLLPRFLGTRRRLCA